jgi:anti-anti-sigma factor
MALKKTSAIGGKLVLCGLQDNIREIFEIAGFTAIFTIFNTLEEAVK